MIAEIVIDVACVVVILLMVLNGFNKKWPQ